MENYFSSVRHLDKCMVKRSKGFALVRSEGVPRLGRDERGEGDLLVGRSGRDPDQPLLLRPCFFSSVVISNLHFDSRYSFQSVFEAFGKIWTLFLYPQMPPKCRLSLKLWRSKELKIDSNPTLIFKFAFWLRVLYYIVQCKCVWDPLFKLNLVSRP